MVDLNKCPLCGQETHIKHFDSSYRDGVFKTLVNLKNMLNKPNSEKTTLKFGKTTIDTDAFFNALIEGLDVFDTWGDETQLGYISSDKKNKIVKMKAYPYMRCCDLSKEIARDRIECNK